MTYLAGRNVETGGSAYLVVVAASAGGLKALERVLNSLPKDFPAAVMVVMHLDRNHPSILAELLGRHTQLRVREAKQGDVLTAGEVYVAPRDHHLIAVNTGTVALTRGDLVHHVRPSADVLFESAAQTFGPRAIAVVLTGTGLDGAAGVKAVKRGGGTVIAQNEATSEFFAMPDAAIRTGDVDFVLPLIEIGPKLISLVELSQKSP